MCPTRGSCLEVLLNSQGVLAIRAPGMNGAVIRGISGWRQHRGSPLQTTSGNTEFAPSFLNQIVYALLFFVRALASRGRKRSLEISPCPLSRNLALDGLINCGEDFGDELLCWPLRSPRDFTRRGRHNLFGIPRKFVDRCRYPRFRITDVEGRQQVQHPIDVQRCL